MSVSFLFIIPLTPDEYLTPEREKLRTFCLTALKEQTYPNWGALLIGCSKVEIEDGRFIILQKEGLKEEKLQFATSYIRHSTHVWDYIIRLDDDDIFNPNILKKIYSLEFDILVDKYHYYFEYESLLVSRQIKYWFPNTCIHKREHALSRFGNLSKKEVPILNEYVSLIENDHSTLHRYYKNKRILYTRRGDPLYLRVVSKDSITSKVGVSYTTYLKFFGSWNNSLPESFKDFLLKQNLCKEKYKINRKAIKGLKSRLQELKNLIRYKKIMFGKKVH